jgi:hypothetical protein
MVVEIELIVVHPLGRRQHQGHLHHALVHAHEVDAQTRELLAQALARRRSLQNQQRADRRTQVRHLVHRPE